MKALQKIISIILILLFAFNAGITPLQAEEGIIEMHSLDELPSSTETPTDDTANRAKLLDALDNAQKNEPSEISFTKDINPSTIVLLSEKVSYERDSFVLIPTITPTMRPNVV